MKIAINAGHCPGLDPGACGEYSEEADICRAVALQVCERLENKGHEVFFVQEDELADVCAVANDNETDIFVSIHCNAYNHLAHGTETFYYEEGDQSYELAGFIQQQLVDTLGTTDRGIKDGSHLYVINRTDMPAVLVELAFIDYRPEEDLLNTSIDNMARAIVDGITEYELAV